MWFLGLFIIISAVFTFLAWRMDRKHKTDVTLDYKADVDMRMARAMYGDDARGHESGPRL